MTKRALIDHRPYLLLSLLFAISYYFAMDGKVGGTWMALWKGASVACLAAYAVHRGRGGARLLIASVMGLGALGDIALEFSFSVGGLIFALSHLVAIYLFLTHLRHPTSASQKMAGLALVIFTPAIAALLTYPLDNWLIATLYALLLGAMAGSAWISAFPRYRVGVGAVLFVASDLVLFAQESSHVSSELASWMVWPLYYSGQFLIVTGVVQALRQRLG